MGIIVKLNSSAVRQLLRSPEVKAEVERRAQRIASAAGAGMLATSEIGPNRARAEAKTDTFEAMRAEASTRDLSRALDAGR